MQKDDQRSSENGSRTGESDNLSESDKENMVKKALTRRHRGKTSDIFFAILFVAVLLIVIYFFEKFSSSPV